jgi:CheY-like chemotaxis protein
MGGDLQVESEKGTGSRFFFTLEFGTTDAAVLREMNQKIFLDPQALKGKNILIVEDNEFNQFIARSILEKWNILVDLASNGKEAIEKVKRQHYDLILMDMQMPVMDGLTATRIIRKDLDDTIPIIALTAFATKEAIEKTAASGMNGYITKPFEEENLFSQLLSSFGMMPTYVHDSETGKKPVQQKKPAFVLHYDLDKLSKLLGDDKAEIIDLIEKFIELTPEYSASLLTEYEQNNIENVSKAAHKIKSSIELLASGNLRSNISLIHDYSRKREKLEKLPKLIKYYRENVPVLLRQLAEKVAEMRNEEAGQATRDT